MAFKSLLEPHASILPLFSERFLPRPIFSLGHPSPPLLQMNCLACSALLLVLLLSAGVASAQQSGTWKCRCTRWGAGLASPPEAQPLPPGPRGCDAALMPPRRCLGSLLSADCRMAPQAAHNGCGLPYYLSNFQAWRSSSALHCRTSLVLPALCHHPPGAACRPPHTLCRCALPLHSPTPTLPVTTA